MSFHPRHWPKRSSFLGNSVVHEIVVVSISQVTLSLHRARNSVQATYFIDCAF